MSELPEQTPTPSPAAVRIAVVLFGLLLGLASLAAVEVVLRVTGLGSGASALDVGRPAWMDEETFARFRAEAEAIGRSAEDVSEIESWRWDPRLRWALRPAVDAVIPNLLLDPSVGDRAFWHMRTNSRGWRTPEFDTDRDPDTVRVVVVGDSNTMGWLLDDDDVYARRVESQLEKRLGRPVEVINLAVSGYTTFACRILVEEVALPLQPDALVVACGANDPQIMSMTDAEYAAAQSSWLGRIQAHVGRLRLASLVQGLRTAEVAVPVERVAEGEFTQNLQAIFDAAREREVPVTYLRVCCCPPDRVGALVDVCSETGTPIVSARKILASFARPGVRARHTAAHERVKAWYPVGELIRQPHLTMMFRDRCHLNPLGTEVVGDALAEHLAGQLRE